LGLIQITLLKNCDIAILSLMFI